MQTFAAFQCAVNESSLPGCMDMRERRFKLLTDGREVGVNRVRFDMVAHIDGVEAESVCGRLYRNVVKADESQVRVQGRTIVVPGANVNCLSQHDGSLSD
jgi:hypothetical protein